jgi:hypothetical protein
MRVFLIILIGIITLGCWGVFIGLVGHERTLGNPWVKGMMIGELLVTFLVCIWIYHAPKRK